MKRLLAASFLLSACAVIRPSNVSADPGQAVKFILDASTGAAPVVWTVTGGTVSPTGSFTAPGCATSLPVTITITATAGGTTASTTVLVDDKVTGVTISPAVITLAPGATQQFTATVRTVCFPAGVVQRMQLKRPLDGGPAVATVVPPGV